MKKISTTLIAFIATLTMFSSCKNTLDVDVYKTPTLKVEDYSFLGDWHNEFLLNAKVKTDNIDEKNPSKEEAMDILTQINIDYAKNTIPNGMDFNTLKDEFNKFSLYSNERYLAERTFLKKDLRSTAMDEEPSLFEMIDVLKREGILSSFSETLLLDLTNNLKFNYEKNLSDYEMKQVILDLSQKYDAHNYRVESVEGEIVGSILAISKASVECWEQNPDLMPSDTKIAPWVAADVAGAAVGAVSGAVGGLTINRKVSVEGVAYGAVAGAVVASTGVVGKLAKWIQGVL